MSEEPRRPRASDAIEPPGKPDMKGDKGLGIPSPEFTLDKLSPGDSWSELIQASVDSLIRKTDLISWEVPEQIVSFLESTFEGWEGIRYVAIYLRVSTEDQRESRDSLQDQLREVLALCLRLGLIPVLIVWEDATGKTYDRPALELATSRVRDTQSSSRPMKGILVWKMNRFGREAIGGIQKLQQLNEAGGFLLYRRRATGRLRKVDLRDSEEKDDAWEALREAEDQRIELSENAKRGRQGDANRGRTYGPRSWFLHVAVLCDADGNPVPEGSPKQKGMEYLLFARIDARARWLDALAALRADPSRGTLAALAERYRIDRSLLEKNLRDAVVLGYYASGSSRSERPIARVAIHSDAEQLEREYDEMQRLLDQIERAPRRARPSKAMTVVEGTSFTFVHITSGKDLTTPCRRRDPQTGKTCGLPTTFRNTNPDDTHAGKDQYVCPQGHTNTVPNDRVLHAHRDGRPGECGSCLRFEFLERRKPVRMEGITYSVRICTLCGATNLCDAETDPARKAAMRRGAERAGQGTNITEVYRLSRQRQSTLSSQAATEASRGTGRRRSQSRRRARSPSGPSRGAEPNVEGLPRDQTRLDSRWRDAAES